MAVLPSTSPPPLVPLPEQAADVPFPTEGWPGGEPPDRTAADLNRLLDEKFGSMGEARFGLSLAFVAIHHGRLVAERYGRTAGPEEQLISWSMAKSITQALLGMLVGDGEIRMEDPAPIPAWHADPNDPRSSITIDQLVRMVPGTEFNEDYLDEKTSHCIDMLFGAGAADMAAYTAALPAIHGPDTVFNYSSGTSVLLARLIADVVGSGPDFESWMRARLLEPLGMDGRLTFDESGTWVGSSYLHATARDFAKFGLLYLRDGVWDGQRLLPEGWVDYARTHRATDDDGNRYGAHWWISNSDGSVFQAAGYETQRIIVDPAADLVLVRLGKTPRELADNVDDWLDQVRALFPRSTCSPFSILAD